MIRMSFNSTSVEKPFPESWLAGKFCCAIGNISRKRDAGAQELDGNYGQEVGIYIVNSVTSLGIGLQTFAISRVCEGSWAQRFTTYSLMEADDKETNPRIRAARLRYRSLVKLEVPRHCVQLLYRRELRETLAQHLKQRYSSISACVFRTSFELAIY